MLASRRYIAAGTPYVVTARLLNYQLSRLINKRWPPRYLTRIGGGHAYIRPIARFGPRYNATARLYVQGRTDRCAQLLMPPYSRNPEGGAKFGPHLHTPRAPAPVRPVNNASCSPLFRLESYLMGSPLFYNRRPGDCTAARPSYCAILQ